METDPGSNKYEYSFRILAMDKVQKFSNPERYTVVPTLQEQVPFKNSSFFQET
jgi:hypothetical protein